ncbi:MAG: histidine kinase dimerization/phospho-acceptor domain-containing protein, partial [Candidatus Saccharimonadales bacterium]|nr:histidine kinase dimerization/phospho-acceptor domain-containing protein [Candidatus Saccharimonadales bacterium]
MIDSLKTFKSSILLSLMMANLAIALIGSGVIFILEGFFDVGGANGVIIATLAGIVLAVGLAIVEQRVLTSPINMVVQALLHVSQQDTGTEPTDLTKLSSKHGLVKQMVESVFKLATLGHEITSDLESQRSFLRDTLDAAPVMMLMFDPEGKLKYANAGGREIIDYDFQEALGQPLTKLLDLHFQSDETIERWLGICRENKIEENTFWERVGLLRRDNSRNIYDIAGHYSKDNTHGIELMLVLIDRTKDYVADESEMDFVAMAAHELRSPITVIRGYLDVFEDELKEVFNIEQRALLQKMTVSAEMLSESVNNILNVARIEQGHIELHIRQADWLDIIKSSYEDLALRAKVHGRELKLEVPKKVSLVAVDRVSISEVLNNLIDNAIKYSFEGGVITLKVV